MKKILLLSLASALPLTTFCNQANSVLKSQLLLNGEWIKNEQVEKQKLFAPQLLKNKTNIYNNKKIAIDLIENYSSNTIAEIYAKTPQKKYQLFLKNNHIYNQEMIKNFIIKKFYAEKTTKYFLPSSEYYSIFDTSSEDEGKIINDGELGFRSSWGKTNGDEKDGKFMFKLKEKNLKNHLIMLQEKTWGKLSHEDIEIETVKPKTIGILPIIKVIDPPIGKAIWTTEKISFNGEARYSKYVDSKQELLLPEGAGEGQEWTNWFKSSFGLLLGLGGLGTGIHSFLKSNPITGVISLVLTVAGIIWEIVSNTLKGGQNTLIPQKIFGDVKNLKKIYNKIMENSFNLHDSNEITWKGLSNKDLSTYIDGKLLGQAWSTAIFGQYSRMALYTAWGAINADISYLVYKN